MTFAMGPFIGINSAVTVAGEKSIAMATCQKVEDWKIWIVHLLTPFNNSSSIYWLDVDWIHNELSWPLLVGLCSCTG